MKKTSPAWLLFAAGCVYFNTLYNANMEYDSAQRAIRSGDPVTARRSLDSVIAKTDRIIAEHPGSKYADDAAILNARSQLELIRLFPSLNTESTRRAIASRARMVSETSSDSRLRRVATGLLGEVAYAGGELEVADSLLSVALDGELNEADRIDFYVTRGRVRLDLGQTAEAEEDLRAAVDEGTASPEVRLDLARTLTRLGEYDDALATLGPLLSREQQPSVGVKAVADSLVQRAPRQSIDTFDSLSELSSATPTQRALFAYYVGRGYQRLGVRDSALAAYDAADELAPNTRSALAALYYGSRWRIETATTASEVLDLASPLQRTAVRASDVMDSAAVLYAGVQSFGNWMNVFESRGVTESAALLRAAEVAVNQLRAPAVGRSLYLRFLEVAPGSPWAPKAILGALSLSEAAEKAAAGGSNPCVGTSGDSNPGAATTGEVDRQLRARLSTFPSDNPYVLAAGAADTPARDSSYAAAEQQLQVRLDAMRQLFEPAAVRPAAPADSAVQGDEDAPQEVEGEQEEKPEF